MEVLFIYPNNVNLNLQHRFENGIFRIEHVTKVDEGPYQCIATNRAGSDSAAFQLRVQEVVGPVIRVDIQPPNYTGQSGDTVTFRCVAAGDIESIRWSKQGGVLPYNSREDRGMLTISGAASEDSGVYICKVTSRAGTSGSNTASVTINESTDK